VSISIEETVYAALSAVLPNTYAVELPEPPTWPAAVFEVNSEPEKGWVMGAGYEMHDIMVATMAKSKIEIVGADRLRDQISAAMEAIPGFMSYEGGGDAAYEGDASVFAYVQNFRVRTRR
jgi:capsular polysaccharide biosynthesis protein